MSSRRSSSPCSLPPPPPVASPSNLHAPEIKPLKVFQVTLKLKIQQEEFSQTELKDCKKASVDTEKPIAYKRRKSKQTQFVQEILPPSDANKKLVTNKHQKSRHTPEVNLSKLGTASLLRYCLHFRLAEVVDKNTPREVMLDYVRKHFNSMRLKETEVIPEFVEAAKKRRTEIRQETSYI